MERDGLHSVSFLNRDRLKEKNTDKDKDRERNCYARESISISTTPGTSTDSEVQSSSRRTSLSSVVLNVKLDTVTETDGDVEESVSTYVDVFYIGVV